MGLKLRYALESLCHVPIDVGHWVGAMTGRRCGCTTLDPSDDRVSTDQRKWLTPYRQDSRIQGFIHSMMGVGEEGRGLGCMSVSYNQEAGYKCPGP